MLNTSTISDLQSAIGYTAFAVGFLQIAFTIAFIVFVEHKVFASDVFSKFNIVLCVGGLSIAFTNLLNALAVVNPSLAVPVIALEGVTEMSYVWFTWMRSSTIVKKTLPLTICNLMSWNVYLIGPVICSIQVLAMLVIHILQDFTANHPPRIFYTIVKVCVGGIGTTVDSALVFAFFQFLRKNLGVNEQDATVDERLVITAKIGLLSCALLCGTLGLALISLILYPDPLNQLFMALAYANGVLIFSVLIWLKVQLHLSKKNNSDSITSQGVQVRSHKSNVSTTTQKIQSGKPSTTAR
ncbi:hypothetical protein BCR33DRAFT_848320 [Rhizoclosmatium globosum]|uniref:Uncharacterized protein n=1 Tax=Rhizoclosmatium globosum TaxID=329046 RepID=A0A1Y2CMS8_9FUNG|nr:hypothetical protein BCR33DRAFT_848320 [Rhizoclosmatium globosum]|eukprot:ORY48312.1 hypothetical protein BCR33DRAFT_848320 [Rhizoclosmatium globosum]